MKGVSTMSAGKYLNVARISFRAKTAYILDVALGSVFYALILFIFVQLWSVLGKTSGFSVEGFGTRELVWYLMASEAIMLGRGRIEREIDEEVKTGAIAYSLNKPYNYIMFKLSTYWGDTAFRMLVNVFVGASVAMAAVGPIEFNMLGLLAVASSAAMALTLNFFIVMLISLTAFWVENTAPFFWIYSKLMFVFGGLFAPMELYPSGLARAASATPFNYVLYAPARLLVQFEWDILAQIVLKQALWIAVLGSVVFILFGMGVKRLNVNGG